MENEFDNKLVNDHIELSNFFDDQVLTTHLSETTPASQVDAVQDWTFISNVVNSFGSIYSSLCLNNVLEYVIDSLISVVQAERGFLLLKNPQGHLEFKIARDSGKNNLPKDSFKIIKSILVKAYKTRAIYYYDDLTEEELLLSQKLDKRSIICCPMMYENKVLGLIYADSSFPLIANSDIKKELVQLFSRQAALAIRNAMFYQVEEQSYKNLSHNSVNMVDVEKMAVQSRLAARIGFTLKNFLQDTYNSLELATKYLDDNSKIDKVVERLRNISTTLQELKGLSTGLIENFVLETNLTKCDLNVLVAEFVQFAGTIYSETGKSFAIQLNYDIPLIKLDKTQMHLVLYNIINYLMSKTVNSFVIYTEYSYELDRVRLIIYNKCNYIPKEEMMHLFDPVSDPGVDLDNRFGLLICKEIILKHGGSLSVESVKDEGIKFITSLPRV